MIQQNGDSLLCFSQDEIRLITSRIFAGDVAKQQVQSRDNLISLYEATIQADSATIAVKDEYIHQVEKEAHRARNRGRLKAVVFGVVGATIGWVLGLVS